MPWIICSKRRKPSPNESLTRYVSSCHLMCASILTDPCWAWVTTMLMWSWLLCNGEAVKLSGLTNASRCFINIFISVTLYYHLCANFTLLFVTSFINMALAGAGPEVQNYSVGPNSIHKPNFQSLPYPPNQLRLELTLPQLYCIVKLG